MPIMRSRSRAPTGARWIAVNNLVLIANFALGVGLAQAAIDAHATVKHESREIKKIYFLIHPLLYEPLARNPAAAARVQHYIDYERKISARWFRAIAGMQ